MPSVEPSAAFAVSFQADSDAPENVLQSQMVWFFPLVHRDVLYLAHLFEHHNPRREGPFTVAGTAARRISNRIFLAIRPLKAALE